METQKLKDLRTNGYDKNTTFSDIVKDITPLDENYIYGITQIAEELGIKLSLMKSIVDNVNSIGLPLEKGKYKNGSTYRISIDDIDTAKRIIAEKYSFDNYVYGKESIIKELNLGITVKEFIAYIQRNNLASYITKRISPRGGYTYALKKEDISKVKDIVLKTKDNNKEEYIVESKRDTVIEENSKIKNFSITKPNRIIESKINMPYIEGFEYIANVLFLDMSTLSKYIDMNLLPDIYVVKENDNYVYRLDFDKIQKCKDILSKLANKDTDKMSGYTDKMFGSTDKPNPIRKIIFNRLNHVDKVSNEEGYSKGTSITENSENSENLEAEKDNKYETIATTELDKRIYLQQKHDELLEIIEQNNLTDLDYIQSSFYLLVSGRDFANIMQSVNRKDNNRYNIADLDNALYLRRNNGEEKYYFRTDVCKILNITGGQYANLCSNGILNPDKKIEIKLNCYINLYKESTVEYLRTYLNNIDKTKLVEYKNEIEAARYIGIDAKEINRFLSEYNLKPTYMESFDRTKGIYNPTIMWFSKESLIFLHGLFSKRYLRENFNTQLRNDKNTHYKKINTDENYMQKCQILNAYKIPEEIYVFAVTHDFMKPDKIDDRGRAGKLYLFYPKTVENFIKKYKKENLGLQYGFTWIPE